MEQNFNFCISDSGLYDLGQPHILYPITTHILELKLANFNC